MYCLHPSKDNPTCWRLQRKSLGVQEYFPFAKYGSREAALLATIKRDEELSQRLKAKKLRSELPYNLMFDEHGNLKGTSFSYHSSRGLLVKMQATINGKQRGTSRKVGRSDLIDVFYGLADWRMVNLAITPTHEIKSQLKISFRLFEQKFKHQTINASNTNHS